MEPRVMSDGETAPTTVLEALREAILVGEYAPGERLIETELASAFGTSRIPLREALRSLEGEGLVIIARNRGAIVRPLDPKDVTDLYDLRLALESVALTRSAQRYVDLRESTERRRADALRAIDDQNLSTLFHLDRKFHAEFTRAADNPYLIVALSSQWSLIERMMHAYLSFHTYPLDVWADHSALAEAVAFGDSDRAVATLQHHLHTSRDHILAHLRDNPPQRM